MIRFILGFVLSVAVTNWAYSELIQIDPSFEGVVSEVTEMLAIPTHNEWPSMDLAFLLNDAESQFAQGKSYIHNLPIFHVTDRLANIKRLVIQKRTGKQPAREIKLYEMVSGEEIFIKRS